MSDAIASQWEHVPADTEILIVADSNGRQFEGLETPQKTATLYMCCGNPNRFWTCKTRLSTTF